MLLGMHSPKLDDKGRVIFPARMRDELGAQVVLQKGIESCVYVFPPDEWEREVEKVAHLVLMLMLPALADGDLRAFGSALTEVQQITGRWFASPATVIF